MQPPLVELFTPLDLFSELSLRLPDLTFLLCYADRVLQSLAHDFGSQQHLLISGLDFKFKYVFTCQLLNASTVVLDLSLDLDAL
jgi:hypothetical protein